MPPLRLAAAAVLSLGLAACQPAPIVFPASTNSDVAALDAAAAKFVSDIALAELMARNCPGVSLRRSRGENSRGFLAAMAERGYSGAQVDGALLRLRARPAGTAGAAGIRYLESKGVTRGSGPAKLCSVARDEVRRGSSIGQYLR